MLVSANTASGQYYYVNTYEGPDEYGPVHIHVKSIDLSRALIISDLEIQGQGLILYKKPVSVNLRNNIRLLSFLENGGFNKNSEMGLPHYITYYSIYDAQNGNMSLIRNDSLIGEVIDFISQFPQEEGFRFGITTDSNSTFILPSGIYTLSDDNGFRLIREVPLVDEPGLIRNMSGYDYLHKIPYDDSFHLYWTFQNMQYWLVELNNNQNLVLDSLQLRFTKGESVPFAYHPGRNKFYYFNVNWESHTKFIDKSRQDNHINPEVRIYDPQNLELIQNISITDYPDGQYPYQEYGLADVIDDYLVYYFFESDDIAKFAPAMLFIFDTRTNQATWLRVGWR